MISVADRNEIPAPQRPSAFAVEIDSIIEATRPIIDNNKIPCEDGTAGWYDIGFAGMKGPVN